LDYETNDRRRYLCGCFDRRLSLKYGWSYVPNCGYHQRQLQKQWDKAPWYRKLYNYGLFLILLLLPVVFFGVIGRVIYAAVTGK
jgi:hypothetical protein